MVYPKVCINNECTLLKKIERDLLGSVVDLSAVITIPTALSIVILGIDNVAFIKRVNLFPPNEEIILSSCIAL
jgi:hypothetical protein